MKKKFDFSSSFPLLRLPFPNSVPFKSFNHFLLLLPLFFFFLLNTSLAELFSPPQANTNRKLVLKQQFEHSQQNWPEPRMLKQSEELHAAQLALMQKLFEKQQKKAKGDLRKENEFFVIGSRPRVVAKGFSCEKGALEDGEEFAVEFRINEMSTKLERLVSVRLLVFTLPSSNVFTPANNSSPHFHYLQSAVRTTRKMQKHKKQRKIDLNTIEFDVFEDGKFCEEDRVLKLRQRQARPDIFEGWSSFDLSQMAARILHEGRIGREVSIYLQVKQNGRTLGENQLQRFTQIYGPFLVLQTEGNEVVDLGSADEQLRRRHKRASAVRASFSNNIPSYSDDETTQQVREQMEAARKQAEYFAYGMALPQPPTVVASSHEQPEIFNNNLTNESSIHKVKLRRRKITRKGKKGRKKTPRHTFDPNDPMLGFGSERASPWERSRLKDRPAKFGASLNDLGALKDPNLRKEEFSKNSDGSFYGEEKEEMHNTHHLSNSYSQKCALRNLTVDIRELGLDERIIAPKRFDAGFCSGACDFPIEQQLLPTNHAILQSLIVRLKAATAASSSNLNDEINNSIDNNNKNNNKQQTQKFLGPSFGQHPPPVCCAPTKFDSLTMLFFDENQNLVLRNYPQMVVLQCRCT